MSLSDECTLRHLLNEVTFYQSHLDENESYEPLSRDTIDKCESIIKSNIRDSFQNLSLETIIIFCETALKLKDRDHLSEIYINYFFQRNTSQGQMYIRALLLQSRIVASNSFKQGLKAEELMENCNKALSNVFKALELISKPENKQKYSFLVYNASVCVYEIIRPLLKENWQKYFCEILEKIDKLFEETDESDNNWRYRYTLMLFQSLYDAEKKPEAFKILDKLSTTVTKKGDCEFQDQLLRLRIHLSKENSGILAAVKKDIENAPTEKAWKVLSLLQPMKSKLVPEATIEKELINLINSISGSILQGQGQEIAGSNKLNPVLQERLAEAGRIALSYNLINITDSITGFLSRAELYIRKAGPLIDMKTGMRLNSIQIKKQEVERRIEALKILDKSMVTNKKLNDAELIYEGCVLIWNIGLPFLNATYREKLYKPFVSAANLLEIIQSNDHQLRVNLHFEIAKSEMLSDLVVKAEQQIAKALALDYSLPLKKITAKIDDGENLSLYQRPYDRYLNALKEKIKIRLKQNTYSEPKNDIEKVIIDLESLESNTGITKSENMRIDLLQKSFGTLVNMEEHDYIPDPSKDLTEEEIKIESIKHKQNNLVIYKQRRLLAGEIAKMAFEWELNDLAIKACEFVVADTWETRNAAEMILIQVECYYILSQCHTDILLKEGYEIAFAEAVQASDDDDEADKTHLKELSIEKKEKILVTKRSIISFYIKALKLAESIQQTWLVFNGAIYVWNNYLPVFKNPTNDSKLLNEISGLLKEFFETMKSSLKELEKKQITDYDIDTKIQVFADIGLIYARLMEGKSQYEEVMKICESLLLTPLNPHTRKLINSIKARVSGVAKTSTKAPDKKTQQKDSQSSESVIFDVVSQLEIIQNSTNKQQTQELIKKCFDTLLTWNAKVFDETELELHAELWARLARLALNQENALLYKYSLRCVENSLSLLSASQDLQSILPSRLRWYSLSEYLYSETLMKMINVETQEQESQEKLLFHALKHAVESANKGMKAGINSLVLDASKQVWNISSKLQDSAVNRKTLIKPIFSTIFYLKSCKEKSEPDLILLLSQLFFKAAIENEEYILGEKGADMVFELVRKDLQKPIWEAKMIFLSKQGKNELHAISNMKEADASLQAKVWLRLARAANSTFKQNAAFNKAIEILKKENSIEIVEVYLEYSEWLLRNNYEREEIEEYLYLASDLLIEVEHEEDEEEEEEEDDEYYDGPNTIFSRSSRGKKSQISKTSKSKSRVSFTKKSASQKLTIKNSKKSQNDQKSHLAKSRSGSQSRMSRASIRVSKTIKKAKQTKTIFSQREEDPNPESLNCAHYERLLRVHAMLAMISKNQESQIQFCLDATFFVTKIFDVSFKTMNQLDLNREKYTKKENDDKTQNSQGRTSIQNNENPSLKYAVPNKVEDWIKLQFSKEFIEKNKTEDFTFMGKYTFDRAEMTIKYITQVIRILENQGMHIHCPPLYALYRFLAKEILNSPFLILLSDLQFANLLFKIGYHQEAESIFNSTNIKKFKLSDQERKILLGKAESARLHLKNRAGNEMMSDTVNKPLLIKEISPHLVWLDLAKELIAHGEISRAKTLVQEAESHAKVLFDFEAIGEIELLYGEIYYLEGDYRNSLLSHMSSHKFIKNINIWEKSAIETVRTLKKLKKLNDIKKGFLNKIIIVVEEMASKKNFNYNLTEINQCLGTLNLLFMKTYLSELKTDFSYEIFKQAMNYWEEFAKKIYFGGITKNHLQMIIKAFLKVSIVVENQNFTFPQNTEKCFKILEKMASVLIIVEIKIKEMLKYTMILEKESSIVHTPLHFGYSVLKIILSRIYSNIGVLKVIMRNSLNLTNELEKSENPIRKESENIFSEYQPLNKFLQKLTVKIERSLMPIPHRLSSTEKAIALLSSVILRMPQHFMGFSMAKIEQARAKRLLAVSKKQMDGLWPHYEPLSPEKGKEEDDSDIENKIINIRIDYKLDSLKYITELKELLEKNKNSDSFLSDNAYYFAKIFNLEMVENFGALSHETSFEYLCRFQHFDILTWLQKEILKKSVDSDYKLFLYLRLIKYQKRYFNKKSSEFSNNLAEFKITDIFTNIPNFKELKEIMPSGSSYLILQLSPNKLFLYMGFMICNKERQFQFFTTRFKLKQDQHIKLQNLQTTLAEIKLNVTRTPIIDDKDFDILEENAEEKYKLVLNEFEEFCTFFTSKLNEFINPEIKIEPETELIIDIKKGAAQASGSKPAVPSKDQKKKGGKDDLASYESPLIPSSGGIESLVIFLDEQLFDLPFERLNIFSKIPAISRDFSALLQTRRLQKISFNPIINNGNGMNRESIKYIAYNFKEDSNININPEPILEEFSKNTQGVKLEGVSSNTRIPSVGEWQKLVSNGSTLFFYGHESLIDIVSPKVLCNFIDINNIKSFVIFDKINAKKTLISKNFGLYQDNEKTPIIEQPKKTLGLLSLLDISSCCINLWSIQPKQYYQAIDSFWKGVGEEIYFAATLNNYKKGANVFVDQKGNIVEKKIEKKEIAIKKDKDNKKNTQNKKNETIDEDKNSEEILKEVVIERKKLYTDNFIYFGLPNIRLK